MKKISVAKIIVDVLIILSFLFLVFVLLWRAQYSSGIFPWDKHHFINNIVTIAPVALVTIGLILGRVSMRGDKER